MFFEVKKVNRYMSDKVLVDFLPFLQGPSGTEKEFVTSKKWGSFFTHPMGESSSKPSQPTMNTMWGYFIRKYASLAVPQLDYIAGEWHRTDISYYLV